MLITGGVGFISSILGWEPDIPLSKGLVKTIAYFDKNFGPKTDN